MNFRKEANSLAVVVITHWKPDSKMLRSERCFSLVVTANGGRLGWPG